MAPPVLGVLGDDVLGDVVLDELLLGELLEPEPVLLLPPAAPDLSKWASHSAREICPSPFVSTDVKLGVEALDELLPDTDGDDEEGLLGEEEDCATARDDSAKSTAAAVMLRVLGMDEAPLVGELHPHCRKRCALEADSHPFL